MPREQDGDPITILMESGSKGPKGATQTAVLEVTDWCTESFPDHGQASGDAAVLRLPASASGYAVYGRIAGKPGDDGEPSISIVPDLLYVEDELGNDLVLLGLVDSSGVATFSSTGEILYRTNGGGTKGKGVTKATNLTGLFEWSGDVCYLQTDVSSFCYDNLGNYVCSTKDLCCTDATLDGIYESCGLLSDVGQLVDDGMGGMTLVCPAGSDPISSACRSYDNEWVFNISDFVGYLWKVDTTGAFNVQIRFYPVQ